MYEEFSDELKEQFNDLLKESYFIHILSLFSIAQGGFSKVVRKQG